jgi:hypothetical protein
VKFEVDSEYVKKYAIKTVGNEVHSELWIPAEELDEFNQKIIGNIELIESFN